MKQLGVIYHSPLGWEDTIAAQGTQNEATRSNLPLPPGWEDTSPSQGTQK